MMATQNPAHYAKVSGLCKRHAMRDHEGARALTASDDYAARFIQKKWALHQVRKRGEQQAASSPFFLPRGGGGGEGGCDCDGGKGGGGGGGGFISATPRGGSGPGFFGSGPPKPRGRSGGRSGGGGDRGKERGSVAAGLLSVWREDAAIGGAARGGPTIILPSPGPGLGSADRMSPRGSPREHLGSTDRHYF